MRTNKSILFFIGIAWSSAAFGYVPPSQFILKKWLEKHAGVQGVKVRSVVTSIENNQPNGVHFKDTTWFDPSTMTLRSVATDDRDRKLYRKEGSRESASLVAKILMSSELGDVTRLLRGRGIPVQSQEELLKLRTEVERRKAESEDLMRWNGTLSWVIGGRLWMEKDTFFPLRLIDSSAGGGEENDFRFEGVHSYREFPFPKTSKLIKNGVWILSSEVIELSSSHEDMSAGKLNHAGSPEKGLTHVGLSESSDLRNLIRLYYESFR